MTEIEYRTTGIELAELRTVGDGRTLTATFVPYGTSQRINDSLIEQFEQGAFRAQVKDPARVPLAYGHLPMGGKVVGRVTSLTETPQGLIGEARISATRDGDDVLELLRDGALSGVSIGFQPGQSIKRPDGVTLRRSARLTELAIVHQPAYDGARVLALREEEQGLRTPNLDRVRRLVVAIPKLPMYRGQA